MRQARGAELPESFLHDPLMYQGASDGFLGPTDPILVADEAFGIDLEAEVAVITDDVPMGVSPAAAQGHVNLVMLLNDVSPRRLIPDELAKGLRLLPGQAAQRLLAGRGHARCARRPLGGTAGFMARCAPRSTAGSLAGPTPASGCSSISAG